VTTRDAPRGWVIADVWETIAAMRPDADCLVQGRRRLSWADVDRRADAVAAMLLQAGLQHQSKVAFFVRNSPAFLIGVFGCLKVGMVPVNTNFRLNADEVTALWEDADVECVVFSADLTNVVAAARPRVRRVSMWLHVDDAGGATPPAWTQPFDAGDVPRSAAQAPWPRDPDDLILLYTGGTTGVPKGVMWRQDDVFAILNASAAVRYDAADGIAGVALSQQQDQRARPRFVPCGPLIHGTGSFSSYGVLGAGGAVILLERRSFDAIELLDTVERERVTHLSIVGDAHGRPIAAELDAHPGRWDLRSVRLITSAGMQLTEEVRARVLAHFPRALCVDILGSSEVPAIGRSRSTASASEPAGTFVIGPRVRVLDDLDRDVMAGEGAVGVLIVNERKPLGYYKDPQRSAALFRIIDGERWSVTGDLAMVHSDGRVQLVGRGASVINTGGEKVYGREVEDVLLRQSDVVDAVVLGVPHEVLGEAVVGVVQLRPSATVSAEDILREARESLAGYKVPKRLHVVESIGRNDSGKIDYLELARRVSDLEST
jgi:acyl-CoA synthetase (AMP-forming)/AMP-acid ligase II